MTGSQGCVAGWKPWKGISKGPIVLPSSSVCVCTLGGEEVGGSHRPGRSIIVLILWLSAALSIRKFTGQWI